MRFLVFDFGAQAMSGPDIAYAGALQGLVSAALRNQMQENAFWVQIVLPLCFLFFDSGVSMPTHVMRCPVPTQRTVLSAYAHTTRCPVLTERMQGFRAPMVKSGICVRACYAMPGTERLSCNQGVGVQLGGS
eukprot:368448-Rhodomonas_salina.2